MSRSDSVTSIGSTPQKFNGTPDDAMDLDTPASSFSSAMDIDSSQTHISSSQPTQQLLYTTGRNLSTFHPFPRLNPSLRKRIWLLGAPAPRTRFLELHGYTHFTIPPKIRYIPPLPALFHVTHESRQLSIAHEGGSLIRFNDDPRETSFYFNFARDIIFLSSRFTLGQNTTETFRLRELSTLLPFHTITRIRRVVITYSSLDSYERIGPTLRPFASLEVLYLAMTDWWGSKTVKRRLRKGYLKAGVEAGKIRVRVEETEAEETDDDEETEGEREERVRAREGRRIVECELRLDE